MIEIFIDKSDYESNKLMKRLEETIEKLKSNGWEKFGTNGLILFFKDCSLAEAREELRKLGLTELQPEEWLEDIDFGDDFL